jgi:diguanylate cyclase (GGDEF)-like protein
MNVPDNATDRLTACLEIGKLLTSTLDLREILGLIMDRLRELVLAHNWSLFLKDETTGELSFELVVGVDAQRVKEIRLPPGTGIAGHVAMTGETLFIPDVGLDSRFHSRVDLETGFQTRSIVCLPLQIHGRILGVLEVINVPDVEVFKVQDFPFLRILADYAAIAIQNSRNFEKIQELSLRDEYTGLYNARHLHQVLDQLLMTAARQSTCLAVAFMDLDSFKQVVDTYGHLKGSQVLREIAQTIQSKLREDEHVFKYGGDEYVFVLPGKDQAQARATIETIKAAINDAVFLADEAVPVRLTASFGIAVYPLDAMGIKDLLLKADNCMFRIKRSGRNAIGVVEPCQ